MLKTTASAPWDWLEQELLRPSVGEYEPSREGLRYPEPDAHQFSVIVSSCRSPLLKIPGLEELDDLILCPLEEFLLFWQPVRYIPCLQFLFLEPKLMS